MIPEARYYECHVTVEPCFDERLTNLVAIAEECGFRPAKLLMQRNREETPTRSDKDFFCTAHGKSYTELQDGMNCLVACLRRCGFKVWRQKIEAVLYDDRIRDE